jgi:tetratricopeptide (TPR) repeat protein
MPAIAGGTRSASPAKASVAPAPTTVTAAGGGDVSRAGLAAYAQGNVAEAITQFTAAVEANPSNAEALNNLGQALVRAGRAGDAIPYFNRAIASADDVWTYHFNRARAYGDMHEWRRAIDGYRDAARLFPDDYATAFNLAHALQSSGDLGGAIEEYQRAVRLAPGQADFPLALASALERAQRPKDAIDAYKRFLDLQDSGPDADKVRKRITELESKS